MPNSSQKKYVIITTINKPNDIVRKYESWKGWEIIIVGDRKTTDLWNKEKVTFLSIDKQNELFPELGKLIPENTYMRKMIGYVYAISNNAHAIFETDDDNAPYPKAVYVLEKLIKDANKFKTEMTTSKSGWINIYQYFTKKKIWPRGYPLSQIQKLDLPPALKPLNKIKPAVYQFLADNDPDVDAIYRIVINNQIIFKKNKLIALDKGTYCPWNSQGTLWLPEAYPLMYLPILVKDRVTDILRSYITTTILWTKNQTVAFSSPIISQDRNIHVILKDLHDELKVYLETEEWINLFKEIAFNTNDNYVSKYSKILSIMVANGILDELNLDTYKQFIKAAYDKKYKI